MRGECSICTAHDKETSFLALYIVGEGIYVCLECRMLLTNYVRDLKSMYGKGFLKGIKREQ